MRERIAIAPFLNDLVLAVVAGDRRCREGSSGRNGEHVADSPHEYGLSHVCLLSGEPAAIRRVAGFDAYAWLITDPGDLSRVYACGSC